MNSFIRACIFSAISLFGVVGISPAGAESLVMRLVAVSNAPLVLPHDLTLTPDGKFLVVADMGQNRVVLLDANSLEFRHVIGNGVMSFPHDVAFDPQGRLLVADSGNDRVMVYSLEGTKAQLLDVWNGLNSVEGIAVAPDGTVYAALTGDNRVVQLKDGKVMASVDSVLGMALERPHDVEVMIDADGVNIIATDSGNHRLIVFDGALNPLYEISTWDPPFSEPKYVSVNEKGWVYVADQYNNRIRVFNAVSKQLGQFAGEQVKLPEGVYAKGDRIWVSDTEGGRVLLYQQDYNN